MQVIKLKRTVTPDNPPSALEEGELALGLGNTPVKVWVGKGGSIEELFAASGGVFVGSAPPTGALPNTLWWDSVGGRLFIFYDDGTSQQWVAASPAGGSGPQGATGATGATGADGAIGATGATGATGGGLTQQDLDNALADYLPLSGGTLTGAVNLDGNPTDPMHAATKQYVDDAVGVIISNTAPANPTVGNLWWDDSQLYVYNSANQWVIATNPSGTGGGGGAGSRSADGLEAKIAIVEARLAALESAR